MILTTKHYSKTVVTLIGVTLLSACSYLPSISAPKLPRLGLFPGVYKIDIEQGNIVTQEMVDELRPGMTKRQVEFLMGTPLLKNTFDQDRWDYVYSIKPGGDKRQQERLTVLFENDALVGFSGNFVPSQPNDSTANDEGDPEVN